MAGLTQIQEVRFSKGDVLFNEGDKSFHFFIIQSGEVEIYKTTPDGQEVQLVILTPGYSFGEFAMLDRQPRSASARAVTDLICAKVSAEAYEELLEDLPDWAVSVMRALVERLRNTNELARKAQVAAAHQLELESAEFSRY